MAETYVIEIRQGVGEPARVELRPGVELAPLGVGTDGSWRVQGNGVLGVHAYIYFDGEGLFVQSAEASSPVIVNGRPIGCEWTPVPAPSTLSLAGAVLLYHPIGPVSITDGDRTLAMAQPPGSIDDDRTLATSPPVTAPPRAARPFRPGEFAHGADESTRLQPVDERAPDSESTRVVPLGETPVGGAPAANLVTGTAVLGRPMPVVRPAAGQPWGVSSPMPATPMGQRMTAPGFQGALAATVQQVPGQPYMRAYPSGPAGFGYAPASGDPRGYAPASGDPRSSPDPISVEAPPTPNHPPPGLLNVPPPATPAASKAETLADRIKREWHQMPPPRRVLLIGSPIVLIACLWWLDSMSSQQAAANSASANASAKAAAATQSVAAQPPPVATPSPSPYAPPTAPGPVAGNQPAPIPRDPGAVTVPQPHKPPPAPVASAAVDAGSVSADEAQAAAAATADKRERTAADEVSTGQYDQAARIYDALAAEHPENPAFREAARILRSKLDAGIR